VPRRAVVAASEELARRDRRLRVLVERIGPADLRAGRPRRTHFAELVRAVCYQQLAGSAARAIHGRLEALYDGTPTAEAVLVTPDGNLRAVGLSGSKVASIKDLATRVEAGEVQLDRVGRLPDAEVVRELTLVRGIGRWTAEMFLMFQLGRLDVWPIGDYGVRKGYANIYGLAELPTERALEPLGEPFRPYRSVAAWYCWRAVDNTALA
jgi:3-methyladenine DNA glycosylase/8-oxoguanine DNA glycosylase